MLETVCILLPQPPLLATCRKLMVIPMSALLLLVGLTGCASKVRSVVVVDDVTHQPISQIKIMQLVTIREDPILDWSTIERETLASSGTAEYTLPKPAGNAYWCVITDSPSYRETRFKVKRTGVIVWIEEGMYDPRRPDDFFRKFPPSPATFYPMDDRGVATIPLHRDPYISGHNDAGR